MEKEAKILVAGHTGLVGSAIVRQLKKCGFMNLLLVAHQDLDYTNQSATDHFFRDEKPDYVFVAAAKVGGIQANRAEMADFCMENLLITGNVLNAAHHCGVKKLLYLGSSCIYPRDCQQPVQEDYLLRGLPEPTNEGYALAKIAGVRLCDYYRRQYGDNFISCIPANVYGPNDNYQPAFAHVVPSLIKRFDEAVLQQKSTVEIWGTGKAEREFLYIDDAAEACVFLMERYNREGPVNIGTGECRTIRELASCIARVTEYGGTITFDTSKPDGMPKRLLDSSRIHAMGWQPRTSLEDGLVLTYDWYKANVRGRTLC